MRHYLTGLGLLLLLSTTSVQATSSATPTEQNPHWWDTFTNNIVQTWEDPQHYDLYLPFLSWHNRWLYDETDHYNEMPWGGGFGVSRYNEEGNWHALYAMMFKDSHNHWQPIVGYGWEKGWYMDDEEDVRLGLGFTAGITARKDMGNYIPLPLVLPLFSASYKQMNLQFTYIPGTKNNGNVLFAWLRYTF